MRPTILGVLFALLGMTFAQTSPLPTCAQSCVVKFTTGSQIGSCGNLDAKCICSNQDFLSSIACCLASACSATDQAAAVVYAQQLCATQGVTVPDAVSCVSSSTTAPATSAASTGSSASSTATSSTSAAASSSASSSASASASASASTPASITKNAGIQNSAGAGMGFAGGLAALVALL